MNKNNLRDAKLAPVRCYHQSAIGVDVHNKILVCCAQRYDPVEGTMKEIKQDFPTSVTGLANFASWCDTFNPELVLMESTGVFWMAPYEALEDAGFDNSNLAIVKATDVKAAFGRKTDKEDARRLAEFARIGTVKKSYVPPRDFREARRIGRLYHKAMSRKAGAINRLHKVLCSIGCRPAMVFSDITGKTANKILSAYVNGSLEEFQEAVATSRKLKASHAEILDVFQHHITPRQKRLLRLQMRAVESCEADAREYLEMLEEILEPYGHLLDKLMTIPGIKRISALKILSELGPDLVSFVNIRSFCSWMGICPGNHESAGKRHGSGTPKGNPYLKTYLVEVAQAISLMKLDSTELRKFFQSVKERRGHNRATVAVAHKIARIIYSLFKNDTEYCEEINKTLKNGRVERFKRSVRNLEQMGVTLDIKVLEVATAESG